jgi:hypothetical protein
MATVLEECSTEEQCSVVRFCGQTDSMQRIFVNKCFLFTVGSVCCFKHFTFRSRNPQGRSKMADDPRPDAKVAETTPKTYAVRVSAHGNATGQVYSVLVVYKCFFGRLESFMSIFDLFTDNSRVSIVTTCFGHYFWPSSGSTYTVTLELFS